MRRIASLAVSLILAAQLLAATLLAATRSVTLEVKGWTCGSCASATKIALKKLDGVADVSTDVDKSEAVVTYEETKVTPQRMIEAIEKIGYKATVKAAAPGPAALPRSEKPASRSVRSSGQDREQTSESTTNS